MKDLKLDTQKDDHIIFNNDFKWKELQQIEELQLKNLLKDQNILEKQEESIPFFFSSLSNIFDQNKEEFKV